MAVTARLHVRDFPGPGTYRTSGTRSLETGQTRCLSPFSGGPSLNRQVAAAHKPRVELALRCRDCRPVQKVWRWGQQLGEHATPAGVLEGGDEFEGDVGCASVMPGVHHQRKATPALSMVCATTARCTSLTRGASPFQSKVADVPHLGTAAYGGRPSAGRTYVLREPLGNGARFSLGSCPGAEREWEPRLLGALGGAVAFGLGARSFLGGEPVAEVAVLHQGGEGVEDHARPE